MISLFSTTSALGATEKPITYKQLEDIINKWVHELDEQETVFLNQAKQVNIWDRLLIENGEKVVFMLVMTSFHTLSSFKCLCLSLFQLSYFTIVIPKFRFVISLAYFPRDCPC